MQDRRTFLKASAALAATSAKVLGANDRVRLAIIGVRGRGWDHFDAYRHIPNVEIAYLCDVDENVLEKRVADAGKYSIKPKTIVDVRQLLQQKDIDAVSIATPNHWHSLIGIWAAQAGKDIYIEKPCSHNWWEGRQLVKAVQKYNIICQHGSQSRSSAPILEAMQHLRDGTIGDVYFARGLCYKWRATIGHAPEQPVPNGVHYDLWTGPAPLKPFTKNRFHYNWHWIWDTGNGDIGNQGIHELDLARWGLGVEVPVKVTAIGGHFLFDDDQQTPNVLTAVYEFDTPQGRKMMNFEVRGWITNHEAGIGEKATSKSIPAAGLGPVSGMPSTIGNIYYGDKGYLAVSGYDSYKTYLGPSEQPGPARSGDVKYEHFANFIDCVRSRNASDLHAPIREGHLSSSLIHLANASYRLGRTINVDTQAERVINDSEAEMLLRGTYRAPYVVPENV